MNRSDLTSSGAGRSTFQVTNWSEILRAKTDDGSRRRAVVGNLMAAYWRPVYCYLRRKGYGNEVAKDLTQGFFHEIVLERDLFLRADPTKGRFRTFILTSLERYVVDVHRYQTRRKNKPKGELVRLDSTQLANVPASRAETTPDQAFCYGWAASLLDEVLAELRQEYCGTGKRLHWEVFRAKTLAPIFQNTRPPSLARLCRRLGIENEAKASDMITTVKRRFRSVLRRRLRKLVGSDAEVEEEIREIRAILAKRSAG